MNGLDFRLGCARDAAKVEAFNRRMSAAGNPHRVSLEKPFTTIAQNEGSPIVQERVFCFEGDELRGGASARRMTFLVNGRPEEVAAWMEPVSEGIINPAFAMVAPRIEREMRRRYPLIFATGALDSGAGEMMYRAGWYTRPIPFHFAVLRAHPFLRNIAHLRRRRGLKLLTDLAAASGLGAVGLALLGMVQRARGRYPRTDGLIVERVEGWGEWVDEVWERVRGQYALIGDRSSKALVSLYPAENEHLIRLRFSTADTKRLLGWAVVTASRVKDHKQFGNMVLGAIVDLLVAPEDACAVAGGTVAALRDANADLVVVNHSDRRWNEAFERVGMLPARTNHYLFLAPELKKRFSPIDECSERFFFTRGDGHGPIHLW
jgi:hypothetical protein